MANLSLQINARGTNVSAQRRDNNVVVDIDNTATAEATVRAREAADEARNEASRAAETIDSFDAAAAAKFAELDAVGADLQQQVGDAVVEFSADINIVKDSIFNIVNFGAKPDGLYDNTTAIQAALDAAKVNGGGTVLIPNGRFRVSDAPNSTLTMGSNTTICGEGEGSVLFFDDRPTQSRFGNDLLNATDCSNIGFRNFTIEGTVSQYPNQTNQKQGLTGRNIDGLSIFGMNFRGMRYMATAFSYVSNAKVCNNKLEFIVRDGIRLTNSKNVLVNGNVLRFVSDDCIAIHTLDEASVPGSGTIITDNLIEDCQGIKVLGAKVVRIENNIIRRSIRGPIVIEAPNSGSEGNSQLFNISISNNTVEDSYGSLGSNYVIWVRNNLPRTKGPGISTTPYPFMYQNNLRNAGTTRLAASGIRIRNNIIRRTLPEGKLRSDLGLAPRFDRNFAGLYSDDALVAATFACHGVQMTGCFDALDVSDNLISGLGTGLSALLFIGVGTDNQLDLSRVLIHRNVIFDCPGAGVSLNYAGSGPGAKEVYIEGNLFDLDPFFRAGTHQATGEWTSDGSVVGLQISNAAGIIVRRNIFKNMGGTGLSVANGLEDAGDNIIHAQFAFNGAANPVTASNKGIRNFPRPRRNTLVYVDADGTSPSYGQIIFVPPKQATSMPTTGQFAVGHYVENSGFNVVLGTAGARYTVHGWLRLTNGDQHVLNTDWAECRTLTGT